MKRPNFSAARTRRRPPGCLTRAEGRCQQGARVVVALMGPKNHLLLLLLLCLWLLALLTALAAAAEEARRELPPSSSSSDGDVRMRLCGRQFVRAVVYLCGASRWKRVSRGEGAPPLPPPPLGSARAAAAAAAGESGRR